MPDVNIALPLVDAALAYRIAGLSVIATRNKAFVGGPTWTPFKQVIASEEQIAEMYMNEAANQVAIICGAVSGNLECLDFDSGGERYPAWLDMVYDAIPGLIDQLAVEATPSGGRHVLYRCPGAVIPGVQKLAMRPADGKVDCLIETRGEGAYFVCSPSPGYEMIQGCLTSLPEITPDERDTLLRCARVLDERPPEAPARTERREPGGQGRPGDDFKHSGNVRDILQRHGWRHVRTIGPNEQWRRPGKERGVSATIRNIDGVDVFYAFTTSTAFDVNRGYDPFQVYAILEHGGDHAAAASELRRQGYGADRPNGGKAGSRSTPGIVENVITAEAADIAAKDAAAWILEPIPPSDPIIEGVFDVGDKAFLIGGSKGRKSFFIMQAALSIASGTNFLGFHVPKARRVVVAQFEIREHHYQRRLRRSATAMWLKPEQFAGRLLVLNLRGKDATIETIGEAIRALKPELVVLDPWYKLYGVGHDENSAGDAATLLAKVDRLAENLGAAIWVCHHDSKAGTELLKGTSRGAGSGLVGRDYDACLLLTPHATEDDAIIMSSILRNYQPIADTTLRWSDNRFVEAPDIFPTPETTATRRVKTQRGPSDDEIIDVVGGWFNSSPLGSVSLQSRIRDKFGIGEKRAERLVAKMVESGEYLRRRNPEHRHFEIFHKSTSATSAPPQNADIAEVADMPRPPHSAPL